MDREICAEARIKKDSNLDGAFYFGVKMTGIFCRPSCPSPIAKEENVEYFNSMYQAMDQGYRPCLRCRPEVTTHGHSHSYHEIELVKNALNHINDGYLNNHSIKELASQLATSERSLRNAFAEHVKIPPIKVAKYQKSLIARQLLQLSDLSITEVCFASGFGSIRQFNDVYKEVFHISPRDYRKSLSKKIIDKDKRYPTLLVPYKDTYDFKQTIAFMKLRALKGVEVIRDDSYARTFRFHDKSGAFSVKEDLSKKALSLTIYCDDVRAYMPIYHQVRRMFDLDTNLSEIHDLFIKDPVLATKLSDDQVPRLPIAYDPFEFVVRAILGQVVSVAFATTLAGRIVERMGIVVDIEHIEGLTHLFPQPSQLKTLDFDGLGLTKNKIASIRLIIEALEGEKLSFNSDQSFDDFHKDFSAIKGIGDWTVNYVAMRGLGMKDSFPYNDLGVIKALTEGDHRPSGKKILTLGENWRPYRAYATLTLWQSLHTTQ